MTMEWWQTIIISLTGLGVIGDLIAHLVLPATRRSNNAGADKAEAEANAKEWELEEARIKQLHDTALTLNDLLKTQAERIAAQNAALDAKTDRIRDLTDKLYASEQDSNRLNALLVEATAANGQLTVLVEHYKLWHCRKSDCDQRQPPRPELKGTKYIHPKKQTS